MKLNVVIKIMVLAKWFQGIVYFTLITIMLSPNIPEYFFCSSYRFPHDMQNYSTALLQQNTIQHQLPWDLKVTGEEKYASKWSETILINQ